jgi:hypothetical protein
LTNCWTDLGVVGGAEVSFVEDVRVVPRNGICARGHLALMSGRVSAIL